MILIYRNFIDEEEEDNDYTDILPFRWHEMNDFDQRDIVIFNVPNKPGIAEDLLAELERDEYSFGPIELLDLTMHRSRRSKIFNAWIRYVHREFHKDAILYYRRLWPNFHGFRLFFEPSHVRIDELNLHSFSELLTNMNKKDSKTAKTLLFIKLIYFYIYLYIKLCCAQNQTRFQCHQVHR